MTTPQTVFQVLSSFERTFSSGILCEDHLTECHLQLAWFEHLIPATLRAADGRVVEVIQTGWWNRESGPDFKGAAIRVDGGPVVKGDIEFHLDAAGWSQHGHEHDPHYNQVVLHIALRGERIITTAAGETIPHVALEGQLPELFHGIASVLPKHCCGSHPSSKPGRCAHEIVNLSQESLRELLRGAGVFRLMQKSARITRQIRRDGPEQALWEMLAETLGYKENRVPFRLVSRNVPYKLIRVCEQSRRDALLFGGAGLLPSSEITTWDDEARHYAAGLWEEWWRLQQTSSLEEITVAEWRFCQTRPSNHPHRRLAALSSIAPHLGELRDLFGRGEFAQAARVISFLNHPFFLRHHALHARPSSRVQALIGTDRIREMIINVGAPWWLAMGGEALEVLSSIRPSAENAATRLAAERFMGPCARFYKPTSALEQQGLLHIYHSYCSKDSGNCSLCTVPEFVKREAA